MQITLDSVCWVVGFMPREFILKIRILIFALVMVFLCACQQGGDQTVPKELVKAPAWSLRSANGEMIHFPGRQGRPVMLLFWATWCPYCKALMPHVQSILDEYPDSGLIVYAISFKDDGDPGAVMEQRGFNFTVLLDGEEVANAYGIKSTPGVFLVDGAGTIQFDMREIQAHQAMQAISAMDLNHSRKAARKTPYYAAAVRKAVDQLLSESSSP